MEFTEQQALVKRYLVHGDRKAVSKECGVSMPVVTMALNAKCEYCFTPATRMAWEKLVEKAIENKMAQDAFLARTNKQLNTLSK